MSLTTLGLFSEPFGATGNLGDNFRRLLGAPALDCLQTVIREAVQNIADAAKLGSGPEISIRIRTLSSDQQQVLARHVLSDLPEEADSRRSLESFLGGPRPVVMEVCDFGTAGLGGPTRADRVPAGTSTTNFIDFLRNVGSARDTQFGGGTYGFGKVALYRASRCNTILVDTLAGTTRRLIGCHLGRSHERPDDDGLVRRYTGRHWWGTLHPEDGVADPLTGDAAAGVSAALGFLPRPAGRTGTSIMILDFDHDDENLSAVGARVVESLLWNFWPRMMRDTDASKRFECHVEVEGSSIPIPAPEQFAPTALFTKAMSALRANCGNEVRPIHSKRPAALLGRIALERGLRSPRRALVAEDTLFPATTNHIALMRPVELVVKYLEGRALPDERLEWAGVFLVEPDPRIERAFADSEPPAHDDWVPDNLPKGWDKTYVNVALRELREIASSMGDIPVPTPTGQDTSPLAAVARALGIALDGVTGDGARRESGAENARAGTRRPRVATASRPTFVCLEQAEGGVLAVFATDVRQDTERSGAVLVADAALSVDGGAQRMRGEAELTPNIVSIRREDCGDSAESSTFLLAGREGRFEIRVKVPADCAVTVEARVLSKAPI